MFKCAVIAVLMAGFFPSPVVQAAQQRIPLELIDQQMIVAARIDGSPVRMIVDTGAGMNLISPSFCRKIDCKSAGAYTNERKPGETVILALSAVKRIQLGTERQSNVTVGIYPVLDELPSGFGEIDGMLSLEFFSKLPFTLDYKNRSLFLEDVKSLADRLKSGAQVPITLEQDQFTLSASVRVRVNGRNTAHFLLDAGTQHTNVDTTLAGDVSSLVLADAPGIGQLDLDLSRREDDGGGTLGSLFLEKFVTTFDLKSWRIVFNQVSTSKRSQGL